MFDRIRRAMICLTTSEEMDIRKKLDEVMVRRAIKEALKKQKRHMAEEEKARRKLEKERRRIDKQASEFSKHIIHGKEVPGAQASQEKLVRTERNPPSKSVGQLSSEFEPWLVPASHRRRRRDQASNTVL
ncbi:hypothetical protein FBULB1_12045 [Fusarium bulbicola]|nr:hypothetical protein FBULB1_12045 [Fusarium bulbicola]